jgi:hypothetical protein
MKRAHIGLLVIGAAIAGGIAVKMTQPPAIPARASAEVAADVAKPAPPPPPPVRPQPITAPAAESKPSPIPSATPAQPAPAPVYNKAPKSAAKKSKPAPLLIAKAKPNQWSPQPYSTPASAPEAARPSLQIDPARPNLPIEAAALPPPLTAPEPPEPAAAPEPLPAPDPPAPRHVTLPTGMTISVRLNESLSTDRVMPGDTFWASLAEPLVVDGLVIAERGARVSGRIAGSTRAGHLSADSVLTLTLSTVSTSDGQRVNISTQSWTKQADSSRNQDLAKIGGGAALGAIIGAIAGGGKGAAIGAGIGGGAGIGAAAATRGKPATVPSEAVINFRLASRVTITEQLARR